MSLPVILRPPAVADVQGVFDELEHIRAGLGEQFSARLAEVLDHIERNPELYGIVWKDVRAVRLRRFQYVLYYVVLTDRVEILAVLHGAAPRVDVAITRLGVLYPSEAVTAADSNDYQRSAGVAGGG